MVIQRPRVLLLTLASLAGAMGIGDVVTQPIAFNQPLEPQNTSIPEVQARREMHARVDGVIDVKNVKGADRTNVIGADGTPRLVVRRVAVFVRTVPQR